MWENIHSWVTTYDPSQWLLSIAYKSEWWNAIIPYSELNNQQKTAVMALIWETQEWHFEWGDIKFWELDEATLRVIEWVGKWIEEAFVTVIAPTNQFWKPYLN